MNSVDRLRDSRRLCCKLCMATRKENLQGDVENETVNQLVSICIVHKAVFLVKFVDYCQ